MKLALMGLFFATVLAAGEPVPDKPKPPVTAPDAPPTPPPGETAPLESEKRPQPANADDLRTLIGVNPVGLKRVEVPRMPAMTLRGFVRSQGGQPIALLEISEINRVFIVQVGTEIPITVAGRVTPVGRAELNGLGGKTPAAAPRYAEGGGQSQIILKVLKVSSEGVTVEAGLLAQTIIIR